jgi:hypothetical protein
MAWEYWLETHSVVERWGAKRQKKEVDEFRERLNVVGNEGWEMIGFESVPLVGGFTGNVKGYAYLTFWKRPKQ